MLKITKRDCDIACDLLNKAKKEGEETWLKPLIEKTSTSDDIRETVGALSHFVSCNQPAFTTIAVQHAPKHAEKRGIPLPAAIAELVTQLEVRLIMYVVNRAVEAKQFESMIDFGLESDQE